MMTQHTVIGECIVSRIGYLRPLAPIIRSAHERWDGLGYPDGLAGEAIPLESRIVLVCDAFHAMISDRPYRARMSEAQALDELRANAGTVRSGSRHGLRGSAAFCGRGGRSQDP